MENNTIWKKMKNRTEKELEMQRKQGTWSIQKQRTWEKNGKRIKKRKQKQKKGKAAKTYSSSWGLATLDIKSL